jgi:hypothetical protein
MEFPPPWIPANSELDQYNEKQQVVLFRRKHKITDWHTPAAGGLRKINPDAPLQSTTGLRNIAEHYWKITPDEKITGLEAQNR